MDWQVVDSATPSLIEHWRRRRVLQAAVSEVIRVSESVAVEVPTGSLTLEGLVPTVAQYPDVMLQAAVIVLGDSRLEGQVVEGVSVAWFEIIAHLERDPDFLFKISWRKPEEIIAGAYEREGWADVILTPRSGDGGRDVIATRPGVGSIRIIDQVKKYKPGHVVTADEVRALLGVLSTEPNVSKGVITTTSRFAPGVYADAGVQAFVPYRLELKDGPQLRDWLMKLKGSSAGS